MTVANKIKFHLSFARKYSLAAKTCPADQRRANMEYAAGHKRLAEKLREFGRKVA